MKMTRRSFNAALGLGGAALGTGLWPGGLGRTEAQSASAPMRFLAVRSPHGVDRDFWIPKQTGGAEPPAADMSLAELTFEYTNAILTPLMPWRSKITVLDGLDTQVVKDGKRPDGRNLHGHQEQGMLLTGAQPPADRGGNYDNHPSLDFYIHGRTSAPVLLTASVEDSSSWKCLSYDEGGRPRSATTDPRALYNQAFPAGYTPPMAGGSNAPPPVDYTAGEQRIMSYGQAALMRLRQRLSGAELAKIDSHLDAMRRLTPDATTTPGGVTPVGNCVLTPPTRDGSPGNYLGVVDVARAHASVIAQAFACGRARAATLAVLNDFPNYASELPEVKLNPGERYHETLVHGYWGGSASTYRAGYTAGLRWHASHFAAVLEELDGVIDPLDPKGGTILDNTIVFWHSEFGHGAHDNQETRQPCIIAGGGGKVLKLGRYLRLRNINGTERVPHNKLLTSILHAMGMTDVKFFGERTVADRADYQGPLLPLMV